MPVSVARGTPCISEKYSAPVPAHSEASFYKNERRLLIRTYVSLKLIMILIPDSTV